jgi:hypothetical protein
VPAANAVGLAIPVANHRPKSRHPARKTVAATAKVDKIGTKRGQAEPKERRIGARSAIACRALHQLIPRASKGRRISCFASHRFAPNIEKSLRYNLLAPYRIDLEWSGYDLGAKNVVEDIIERIRTADMFIFDNLGTPTARMSTSRSGSPAA